VQKDMGGAALTLGLAHAIMKVDAAAAAYPLRNGLAMQLFLSKPAACSLPCLLQLGLQPCLQGIPTASDPIGHGDLSYERIHFLQSF
jgi:hypothetical protein